MPDNRYFSPDCFSPSKTISIKDKESHHLCRVMRKKIGDEVEVVNGEGDLAIARVQKIEKDSVELAIENVENHIRPIKDFRLIQSIVQMAKLELIVEKCIELGCTEFWFFGAARSEFHTLSENKLERLNYIMISAMKQCGSFYLPKIKWIDKIEKIAPPSGPLFFGDLRENTPRITYSKESCSFINGPESGFTEKEILFFQTNWHAKGISLHDHTLRTETAAITAAAFFSTI
ncbi:MAG: 16S rRNA (uracil(1498)-N(3))-methyltransferase [Chlamydiae bacterium]|nr:16S rRNA (uracil(1498)-N(3))-methyltransferase [Chlamydiota bacterium]